jgi:hypothetical protein
MQIQINHTLAQQDVQGLLGRGLERTTCAQSNGKVGSEYASDLQRGIR